MFVQQTLVALAATAAVNASKALMPTPPMGFNNWARFECALNETLFTETADAMVSNGLEAAGYDRVNIDDCWPLHERAANGSLQWDPVKFPNGLIWLGQYLKDRNLKFGIYGDAGNATCGGYPGSLGYEDIDSATFASWGIDYLKLDGCNVYDQGDLDEEQTYQKIYSYWHSVLSNMAEPLIFSESAPAYFCGESNLTDWYTVMAWVPLYGELARHSDDIATFDTPDPWGSILTNYGFEILLARVQSPGYFNDPDFLIVDHPDLSMDEKKSHFALWCSFSAPLIISAYIPDLTDDEIAYLTNENLLAVDQDALGLQATLISQDGTWDVLSKTLSNGDRLLTILNRGATAGNITVPVLRLGYPAVPTAPFTVQNLWTGDYNSVAKEVTASVPSHGTAVFRISSSEPITPTGQIFNTASLNCLTREGDSVSWTPCSGSDAQVWQVTDSRTIRSIVDLTSCLVGGGKGQVSLKACSANAAAQKWGYAISGNVVNQGTSTCLSEGDDGGVTVEACAMESDAQVFELPSGSLSS
jgi:alpha-galactosidase